MVRIVHPSGIKQKIVDEVVARRRQNVESYRQMSLPMIRANSLMVLPPVGLWIWNSPVTPAQALHGLKREAHLSVGAKCNSGLGHTRSPIELETNGR
jgi:hypothetical protein